MKRPWPAVVLLLAALVPVPPAAGDEPPELEGEGALAAARGRIEAGTPREAARILERALARSDGADTDLVSRLESALGRALVLSDETYRALQYLEAVADRRGLPCDHLDLAEALLSIGRTKAASPWARWIEVGPYLEDAEAQASRAEGDEATQGRRRAVVGEARYWLGKMEPAVAAWDGIQEGDLPPLEARRIADLKARALYDLGRYDEAVVAFEGAGNLRGTACALAAARRGPETIRAYGRLLATSPGDEDLLAEALTAARYTGAEIELAGVLADLEVEGNARAAVLVTRGLLAEATGAFDAARRLLSAAAEADPEAARPRHELGRLGLRQAGGDHDALDAAVGELLQALVRDPEDANLVALLWDLAGQDYAAAWRSERALARTLRIQTALTVAAPDDGLTWANLGNTLRVAGRLEEALGAYDRALEAEPGDAAIVSDRGLVLSGMGRFAEALRSFEEATQLDPDLVAARQNAARRHWRAGQGPEALAQLAEAEVRTRFIGGDWMRYRFLLDRVYRTRVRPEVR